MIAQYVNYSDFGIGIPKITQNKFLEDHLKHCLYCQKELDQNLKNWEMIQQSIPDVSIDDETLGLIKSELSFLFEDIKNQNKRASYRDDSDSLNLFIRSFFSKSLIKAYLLFSILLLILSKLIN